MTAARALVLQQARSLEPTSFELPELGEDDGILRIEACGLCGTDHEQWSGHIIANYAYIPGHEIVGVIEAVGPRAAERWHVAVGDRVAVEVFLSCRQCAWHGRHGADDEACADLAWQRTKEFLARTLR